MYNIIYTYTIYNKSLLKKIKKVFQLYNLSRETIEKGNYNLYRYGYTFYLDFCSWILFSFDVGSIPNCHLQKGCTSKTIMYNLQNSTYVYIQFSILCIFSCLLGLRIPNTKLFMIFLCIIICIVVTT